MSLPLVTCICLTTAARRAWLPRAIECFQAQTYAARELLIVGDDGEAVSRWEESSIDARIFVTRGRLSKRMSLGEKHNVACAEAAGSLIAKWDDDDWSHPQRLTDQVERLQTTGKAVTGYSQMKFTDGTNWWQYVADRQWPLGTSLLFEKEWWSRNRFPDDRVASDNGFIFQAQSQSQVSVAQAGDKMVARIHSGNLNNRTRDLAIPSRYLPLDPAREAIPAAVAGWPAEARAC